MLHRRIFRAVFGTRFVNSLYLSLLAGNLNMRLVRWRLRPPPDSIGYLFYSTYVRKIPRNSDIFCEYFHWRISITTAILPLYIELAHRWLTTEGIDVNVKARTAAFEVRMPLITKSKEKKETRAIRLRGEKPRVAPAAR